MTRCPFCGRDPFHYVDNGIGMEAVAVTCCEMGDMWFRGQRPQLTGDITIDADEFQEIGATLSRLRAELMAWQAWVDGLRCDFVGVTDNSQDGRLHDWEWITQHRPAPDEDDSENQSV